MCNIIKFKLFFKLDFIHHSFEKGFLSESEFDKINGAILQSLINLHDKVPNLVIFFIKH